MPCERARSRTVPMRMEPVKCRCRWALGRSCTSRVMRASVSPAAPGSGPPRERPAAVQPPVLDGVRLVGDLVDDVHGGLLGRRCCPVDADVGGPDLLLGGLGATPVLRVGAGGGRGGGPVV